MVEWEGCVGVPFIWTSAHSLPWGFPILPWIPYLWVPMMSAGRRRRTGWTRRTKRTRKGGVSAWMTTLQRVI